MRRAALVLVALTSSGCVVDVESSAVGKPCPCPSDLVCDESAGVCAEATTTTPCEPTFVVANFRADWTMPESIRWAWDPPETGDTFSAYRLLISSDEAALERGEGTVFDSTRNAELGSFTSPGETTPPPVSFTVTDELASNTPYFARLEAIDSYGCVFSSNTASTVTHQPATGAAWLYVDDTNGYVSPCELVSTDGCGNGGTRCLECEQDCLLDDDWQDLYLRSAADLGALPSDAITSGRAFLQLSVALTSMTTTYYSEPALMLSNCVTTVPTECQQELDDCCNEGPWYSLGRVRLRAGEDPPYQKLELPLDAFEREGVGLSVRDLQNGRFCGLRLGSQFINAERLRIDDVGIRW